jgi:hypothetical protein
MRKIALVVVSACACFNPSDDDDGGANSSTGSSDDANDEQTSLDETSASTMTMDSTQTATEATDPSDGSSSAETTSADATTDADDTSPDSSSSDTGPQPGCADFDGRVIYINMGGATLTAGLVDNAPANIIDDDFFAREWAAYTTDDADEVYALVQEHFEPFHVCLTREPPAVDDYTMIVVSSETYMDNPNFISGNHYDCSDAVSNSVNVVVLSEKAGLAATTKAIGISKFTARVFGLESVVDAPDDIMNQFVGTTLNGATFTDTCITKVGKPVCDSMVACAAGEQQSGPYLEALFGPA